MNRDVKSLRKALRARIKARQRTVGDYVTYEPKDEKRAHYERDFITLRPTRGRVVGSVGDAVILDELYDGTDIPSGRRGRHRAWR